MGNSSSRPTAKTGRESFSTSTTKELPPPYDTGHRVKASDVPQWCWSNKQCREWLTAVLIEYGSLEKQEAELRALKFEGFGPSLFGTTLERWNAHFGSLGHSIYCLIFEKRKAEGAVPDNMTFSHFEPENRAK
jgi:hypothetical protein